MRSRGIRKLVKLPQELYRRLRCVARKERKPISALVTRAVLRDLERAESEDDKLPPGQ